MKVAIYARKSIATDKGESIENQINRGIALCEMRGWDYEVYQDYDYSGKTLDRPAFERMMKDARANKLSHVICYKLDRVSRSVNDFSSLIEELNTLGIGFICINDNFDTTTPLGRATMYITATFAQLERETIAERVRDNMIDRAKMGKWNGGPVPFGFDVQKENNEYHGRNKKSSKLIINEDEAGIFKEFCNWYLESEGSIRQNVFRANNEGYTTKNGALWNSNQMSRLIQNPLYCVADAAAYEYFSKHTKVTIVNDKAEFDGTHGLMFYNRRKPHKKTTKERDQEEWLLVIGEHPGIISGDLFRKIQLKLSHNKQQAPRTGQSEKSPLIGLVKCGRCDSAMSVFNSRKSNNKASGYFAYFRCITREQKSKIVCDNSNVRADILEEIIIKHIGGLCKDKNLAMELFETSNETLEGDRVSLIATRNKLQSEIDNTDKELNNLVVALGKGILPEIVIMKRYKELENQKKDLEEQYMQVDNELSFKHADSFDIDMIMEYLENFEDTYEYLTFDEKKKLLRSIIKEVRIDKDKVKLTLYFLPNQELNLHADCLRMDMHVLAKCKIVTFEIDLSESIEDLPEDTIGQRVTRLRKILNLNIKQLAQLSGLSPSSISNIEKENKIPYISTLRKLCKPLNTTMGYLLQLQNMPENTPGQIIKKYRLSMGISQNDLAKLCSLEQCTIKDYEEGYIKGNNINTLNLIYEKIGYKK